jgi:hypothetical protein
MRSTPARLKLTIAVIASIPTVARAADATLTWDAAPATPGVQGGAGTWASPGGPNWFNGTNNVTWANVNVDSALFNATPAGTVNLSGTVVARFVTFDVPGYTLSGGTLQIGRSGSVDGGIVANADATIASPIRLTSGGDGWYKSGAGTLTFEGSNTGSNVQFTIKQGTVAVSSKGRLPDNTRLTNFGRILYTGTGSDIGITLTAGSNSTDAGIIDIQNPTAYVNLVGYLDGTGMLVKQGPGTFAPQYATTFFTGLIRVDAGTLLLGSNKVINGRPVNLNGGTLILRASAPTDFLSPVTSRGTNNTIALQPPTLGGASGAQTLPSLQNFGTTDLFADPGYSLTVPSLSNTGTLNLNNTLLTVNGPFTTPAGAPPGTFRFGHNNPALATDQRGLWIANAGGSNAVNSTFAGQTEDADLLLGYRATGVTVGNLTLNGAWRGGGGSATSTIAITNSAQVNFGPLLRFNTLTADRTAFRPFDVLGAGSARSTLSLDPAFVADHTNGGATDDGLGQVRLADVTLVSQNSAGLPAVTKLAAVGGPTHRAGGIVFEKTTALATDSGVQWIVRANDQVYDGAVRAVDDGAIKLERNLTLTGSVQKADNQLQVESARTLTVLGPGTLTLSGDLGFAQGSTLLTRDATVVFNTDPGAGWAAGRYIRKADGTPLTPSPINALTLRLVYTTGGAVFNAPVTRLHELFVGGTAVVSASPQPASAPHILRVSNTLVVPHAANQYLDLKNNALVTSGTAAAALSTLRGMLQNNDIRSSLADGAHALGYARASQVATPTAIPESYTWLGQTVNATDLLVRFTLLGDATLDGAVDFQDLVHLAQNYDTTAPATDGSWWTRGDFTNDGVTDFNDLVKLAQSYNTSLPAGPIPGAPSDFGGDLTAAFAGVPEPSGALAAFLGGLTLACRRRRS